MPFDRVPFIRRPMDGQCVRHNTTPSLSSTKRFFVLFTRRGTDNSYTATCRVERNTAGFFNPQNKSSPSPVAGNRTRDHPRATGASDSFTFFSVLRTHNILILAARSVAKSHREPLTINLL